MVNKTRFAVRLVIGTIAMIFVPAFAFFDYAFGDTLKEAFRKEFRGLVKFVREGVPSYE